MANIRLHIQPTHPRGWRLGTACLRVFPVVVLATHVAAFNFDEFVVCVWQWLTRQSWSSNAMLEANVAAFSFLAWILWFRFLDSLPCFQRFRFVQRDGGPAPSELLESLRNLKAPSSRQQSTLHIWASLPVYLGAIALLHCVKSPTPCDPEPPSFLRLVAEVAAGIWLYDLVFYWIHLLMHRFPRIPHGHALHHELSSLRSEDCLKQLEEPKYLESASVVNHSLVDGGLQVAVNIFVQNFPLFGGPKHKLSRLLHNIVVTYLLTEAHAGLDLPWCSHRVYPEIFGGALRHEIHHHLHRCCFHQFFKYLDDWLGYGPPADTVKVTQGKDR